MKALAKHLTRLNYGLLIIASLYLAACDSPVSDAVRFGLASAPISLDPRFATDAASSRINRLLYQRLVDFDEQFRPIPALAEWRQLTPFSFRFQLRDSVQRLFENGKKLSAVDVKATYDFILDKKNASPHRGSVANIDHIQVVDENTIDFRLKKPDPLFPAHLVIGIVPAMGIDKEQGLNNRSMGSGAFRFVAWPSNDHLIIERRRDKLRIEFIHVQDATVRVLKLLRGEIDILQNDLPRELVHYLERQNAIQVKHRAGSNFSYLGFNMKDPALTDIRVRQAIAHAIDRHSLIRYLLGGKTQVANALLSPEHWAGITHTSGYVFNPSLARRLLFEAGYSDKKPLVLEYKTTNDPFRIRIATIIQQQLGEVGIKVKLLSFDWATFYGDIKAGRFQLYTLSWVGIKSPDIFRYVFHSESLPPQGANRGQYANEEVDQLIDKAESAIDPQRRAAYYRQLQQLLLQDLPFVPLWYEEHFYAANREISGYQMALDGNYDGLKAIMKTSHQQPANQIE